MYKGKIYYTPSGVVIHPYENGQCKTLESYTSIYNRVYHKRDAVTGFYIEKLKIFVTHYRDPNFMQMLFPDYLIEFTEPIKSVKIPSYELKDNIILTPLQFQMVNKTVSSNKSRVFLNLPTASGKTILSIHLIISILSERALIICYSKNILNQWVKSLSKNTNINMSKVTLLDKSKQLDLIYENEFNKMDSYIYLCTPTLLSSYGKNYGWDRINAVMENLKIGIKIYDEAHRHISNIIKIDGLTNIKKTIYLSADFNQSGKDKKRLYYYMFNNCAVFTPSEETITELKYTNAVVIAFKSNPSSEEKQSIFNNSFGFSRFEYMRYQMKKGKLLETAKNIIEVIQKTNKFNSKILILVSLIDHVDTIFKDLETIYSGKYIIGRFHSKLTDEERKFTLESAQIIISTYSSLGTGIDIEGNKIQHILSLDQVNEIEDNQSAGRGRRDERFNTFYYIFVDKSINYCVKKLNSRLNYLKKWKIKKIHYIEY